MTKQVIPHQWPDFEFLSENHDVKLVKPFFFSKSNINSQQVGCGISANTIWL